MGLVFLYFIDMRPLLKRGGGPLLSAEQLPFEVSLRPPFCCCLEAIKRAIAVKFDFYDFCEFFVISDFSLVGVTYLEDVPLFMRIFLTVLLVVDETIEDSDMMGPLAARL